ncbi:MAG TPA: bifunctional UDP-N-acetylglucosamine diphosphorylase/glucosamine-1-phosphate N-acetyltransferase GlmU [Gaiellaceae bacterium]
MDTPRLAATNLAVIVMAAGLGTRMRSAKPKHFHELLGRRMVDWVIAAGKALEPERFVVVTSPESADEFEGVEVAVQPEPRGTGDAVAAAREALDGFDGDILVLSGDTPLLTREVLEGLVAEHRAAAADVTILSFDPERPFPYGRVIRDESGSVQRVVEEGDATPEERDVRELNSSIYVLCAKPLWAAVERLTPQNAQGELYLTDTVEHVLAAGGTAAAYRSPDPRAPEGVNTRADLASAAAVLRDRVNEAHMLAGVTIVDPQTAWIEAAVELEQDAIVQPFTVLRGRTRVASGAEVGPHVVAIDATIGHGVSVGPFCYLRPGTVLEAGSKAGTFVEIKNSRVGERTKVSHMSYIGDAEIGEDTNIAAGNITANYPHAPDRPKGKTTIGRNVRTAVHDAFVAPVSVGDGAWIAAGTVITEDVPPESLAGFPPRQVTKEGYLRGKRDD